MTVAERIVSFAPEISGFDRFQERGTDSLLFEENSLLESQNSLFGSRDSLFD